jgi:hypothetical protein
VGVAALPPGRGPGTAGKLLPNPELRASVGTRGRESVEDWQLALLIAVVVLADIPVLFWLLRHRGTWPRPARTTTGGAHTWTPTRA